MSDTQILTLIAFISGLIPIFTIIVKVNGTLTKLNIAIDSLSKQMDLSLEDRGNIHSTLNNHETRITVLEKRRK